jgi:hypothetical protein
MIRYSKETNARLQQEAKFMKTFAKREAERAAKVLEASVKKAVKERLEEIGAYQHWPVQYGWGKRTLDCIGCYRSLYFAVETKKPGKLPTLNQKTTMQQIQDAGGLVFVVDTVEKARDLFNDRLQSDRADPDPP